MNWPPAATLGAVFGQSLTQLAVTSSYRKATLDLMADVDQIEARVGI